MKKKGNGLDEYFRKRTKKYYDKYLKPFELSQKEQSQMIDIAMIENEQKKG